MMKFINTLIFSLLLLGSASAQEAEEYFHGGAQSFIKSDLQQAISMVQQGLNQYPDDPKLNALMDKLKEEQEKQRQQQQQNQNQQQQQNQQQNQQQQDQQQNQQNQDQDQNQQQDQQNQNQSDQQDNPDAREGQPSDLQNMTKEEAEKILKALAQKEKELLKEFKKKKTEGNTKHEKDW